MELVSASGVGLARGVRRPGLLALPPGVERYFVSGRSARAVGIEGGDVIRLVNAEGAQACELVCLADDGRFAEDLLGERAGGSAAGLRRLVAEGIAQRRPRPLRRLVSRSLRAGEPRRRGDVVHRVRRRHGDRGGTRSADGGRRAGPADADRGVRRACGRRRAGGRGGAARAAGRPAPRPADRPPQGRKLRGARRRVDPDHRCRRAPVHGLPGLPSGTAGRGRRALPRRDHDPLADGARLSPSGAAGEVPRPGFRGVARGGAGHLHAPRRLRVGLHGQVLRGPGLPRPRQLLR